MTISAQWVSNVMRRACVAITLLAGAAYAGDADVIDVKITEIGDNRFQIAVTLEHADEGWDHYADRWDVLDLDGEVLGSRVLAHPHVNEQPFTRSLSLSIPASIKEIIIRANDSVHESNGVTMKVTVPGR